VTNVDYEGWVRAALVNWANKNGGVQIVGKNGAQYIVRDGVEVARVTVDDPQEVAR
jgi:hypothetical protein